MIRVDPDKLRAAANLMAQMRETVEAMQGEALRLAAAAPSYDGQFGPQVQAIGDEAIARLRAIAQALAARSDYLEAKAEAFEAAEHAVVDSLGGIPLRMPPPDGVSLLEVPPWLVEAILFVLSFFAVGDILDLLDQLLKKLRGEEVNSLVVLFAALGLLAEAGHLLPTPGAEDAPNAVLAALKAMVRNLPPGPTREALQAMAEQGLRNAAEGRRLFDLLMEIGRHEELALALGRNPDALLVVLRRGSEAVEVLARHGDEGVRLVAEHGDEALQYLAQHADAHTVDAIMDVVDEGSWVVRNESMSDAARAYQEFVTGRSGGQVLEFGGVTFDGFDEARGVLLEAKEIPGSFASPDGGFASWVSRSSQMEWVDQATRQIRAANGAPLEWHFSEPGVRDAMYQLFEEEGIDLSQVLLLVNPMP